MAKPTRTKAKPVESTTRRKLIEAAHGLIWANSYAQVSVEDICREAGVQKGSFYHFFPTKSDLAAAALEEKWRHGCETFDALVSKHGDPRAQLQAICREILTKQQEALSSTGMVCGCPYATLASEMSGNNEALHHLSEKMAESFAGYFEKLLKSAVKAKLIPTTGIKRTAREMHIYTLGAMLEARLSNHLRAVGPDLYAALLRLSRMDVGSQKSATKR